MCSRGPESRAGCDPRSDRRRFRYPCNDAVEMVATVLIDDGTRPGLNRPGFDGGSAYWFPTRAGKACLAA